MSLQMLLVAATKPSMFTIGFMTALSGGFDDRIEPMTISWVSIGFGMLASQLSATARPVCYFLLRSGKQQVDVKEIAAVFD